MECGRIKVENFRNIEKADVRFSEGTTVLVGDNGQGKTNLLEAVYYAAVGKSFRAASAPELINFGKPCAKISLDYRNADRANELEILISRDKQRQVRKNNLKLDKLSDLVGQFRAVLFCPEHLSMIKDGPAARRSFLDIAISRVNPSYLRSLQVYCHFLKQRNALIKNAVSDRKTFDSTVEIYSSRLADEAAKIAKSRYEFLRLADGYVAECVGEMTEGREKCVISYSGSAKIKDGDYSDTETSRAAFYKLLMSSHSREIAVGATLWGTHKDDMEISMDGVPARVYASQGQQRSLALALKIAEGEITRKFCGDYPVFLFDDVLSELDGGRRKYLLEKSDKKQVIITACDIKSVKKSGSVIIEVKNGSYKEL